MNIKNILALLVAFFLCREAKSQESTIIYPSADMWMGNRLNTVAQNGDFVKIGGWGDKNLGFWKFDWSKVRTDAEVEKVGLYFYPDTKQNANYTLVSSATFWLLTSPWSEKSSKITDPLRGYNLGSFNIDRKDGLALDITSLYEYWVEDKKPNHGFMLFPDQTTHHWYHFPSRESGHDDRVRVVVFYKSSVPNFKMPLPGGKEWRLTVEAGGKSEDGVPDTFHTGNTYYSLDFSSRSRKNGVVTQESNVPILSIGGGVVYEVGADKVGSKNGNYIKIDHDGDRNPKTGYQSVYLHLKHPPTLKVGNTVKQGEKLGIMGNTGASDGIHLHLTLYYKGTSGPELKKVKIDGRLITDYRVGTISSPKFYSSSNTER